MPATDVIRRFEERKHMASVVFLRGVNVGGHRTFSPRLLSEQLRHMDVTNIGAAGTFVVRQPLTLTAIQQEFIQNLPFETEIVICDGRDIFDLISLNPFKNVVKTPETVFFVGVLSDDPPLEPEMPAEIPAGEDWLLKIMGREGRFICGIYRRHMKAISFLGKLDRILGVSVTVRNWNTINSIEKVLRNQGA